MADNKMHPLVVFKEMYDQYRIDGGDMSFKEFFDMIQGELNIVNEKAGGGMATMDDMIRPIGYERGGEIGFLTEPPPGMEFKPTMTMEYRDYNQNGKEDRSEGLYLPKDFQPKKEEDIPNWLKEARKEFGKQFVTTPELSEEQKKRLKIQKIIREKQREEMGLPDSMQLLNQGGSIRPLGYAAGGPIPPEPEKNGMFIGNIGRVLSLIKDRLASQQREDGGEEYMKIFNFLWDKGFDAQQIDDIINRRVNQEDLVPSRENLEEKFKG